MKADDDYDNPVGEVLDDDTIAGLRALSPILMVESLVRHATDALTRFLS